MSNFAFLQAEWPLLHESAARAEGMAHSDPRAACFYARRTLEMAVAWLYKHDRGLRLPYQDNLSALIHEPSFARVVGEAVFTKTKVIKELGNLAVQALARCCQRGRGADDRGTVADAADRPVAAH